METHHTSGVAWALGVLDRDVARDLVVSLLFSSRCRVVTRDAVRMDSAHTFLSTAALKVPEAEPRMFARLVILSQCGLCWKPAVSAPC